MAPLSTIRQTVREIIDLSSKSAILADPKSKVFCQQYASLKRLVKEKSIDDMAITGNFLKMLCKEHGLKNERLYGTLSSLVQSNKTQNDFEKNFNQNSYEKLNKNIKPEYYELFQSLGRVKDGVQTIVTMRQDLLSLLEEKSKLFVFLESKGFDYKIFD